MQMKAQTEADKTNAEGGGEHLYSPIKHMPFPEFSSGSELENELIMFLFTIAAGAMQFINIYRTVWWLPESYTNHVVNLYLIEPYLFVLIVAMSARRFLYCLLIQLMVMLHSRRRQHHQPQQQQQQKLRFYRNTLKYGFSTVLCAFLLFCVAKIYVRHTYLSFFLLVYPLIVYLLIFGFQIEPFLRSSCEVEGIYFNGMPMHCCSSNPATIRQEIDVLKNDFNNRFKQVIFTSVVNAYYAGFVPCFFAFSIYYNVLWVTQHIIFIWLSCFTLCMAFMFPSKYSDILHRGALHLGHWSRFELEPEAEGTGGVGVNCNSGAGSSIGMITVWNKTVAWPQGTVIKHCGELMRSVGPVTVALPGNSSHARFYKLFHNPSVIYTILTSIQAIIVLTEIILLYFAIEWHFILSISFITLTNQFTFFKIMRDFLVTKRVYNAENSIADSKQQQNQQQKPTELPRN